MFANYVSWFIFGSLSGWIISQVIQPARSSQALSDVMLGAFGAILTGLVMQLFIDQDMFNGFNVSMLILSILGSILLLITVRGAKTTRDS